MGASAGMYPVLKRLMDIAFAAGGILVVVPILLFAAIAIRLDSPGPVIFKQKRVGRDYQLFDMYKFRTMRVEAPSEVPTHEFSGGMHYVTSVGRILRKTSADELPQLWNILRRDMSFVGPRSARRFSEFRVADADGFPRMRVVNESPGSFELHEVSPVVPDGFHAGASGSGGGCQRIPCATREYRQPRAPYGAAYSSPELVAAMGQGGRRLAEVKYDVTKINHVIMQTMGLLDGNEEQQTPDERGV